MPVISKFANANTTITTGWSTPTSAYDTTNAIYSALTNPPASGGGEGSQAFATAAPGKNASITSDYGFPAFSSAEIPDGSVINSVTVEIRYKSSTTGSTNAVIGLQVNNNGTLLGSESTFGMNLSDQTVTKADSSGSVTLAILRTANQLKARLRGARANSNTAITWSVDYVRVTVDYNPGVTGVSAAANVNAPAVAVDEQVPVTGVAATADVGTVAVGQNATVVVSSGVGAACSVGAVTTTQDWTVSIATGVNAPGVVGTVAIQSDDTEFVVGVSATANVGSVIAGNTIDVVISTGVGVAAAVGTVAGAVTIAIASGVSSAAVVGAPTLAFDCLLVIATGVQAVVGIGSPTLSGGAGIRVGGWEGQLDDATFVLDWAR